MAEPKGFQDKVSFVWAVADLLRGDFKPHEYAQGHKWLISPGIKLYP